ncbi:MAG: hypothetical protein LBT39_01075, partial [Treponema sp.]|nr:hypothetical protein [Treponema sp.]
SSDKNDELQKAYADKQFTLQQASALKQYGIQKTEAQGQLGRQAAQVGQNVDQSVGQMNTGLLSQAYGIQNAQIQTASNVGASLAAEGAGGTRGNTANGLARAYEQQSLDRNVGLQNRQNSDSLAAMMSQAGNAMTDIRTESASWDEGGYRAQLKDESLAYNQSVKSGQDAYNRNVKSEQDVYYLNSRSLKDEYYNDMVAHNKDVTQSRLDRATPNAGDYVMSIFNGGLSGLGVGVSAGNLYNSIGGGSGSDRSAAGGETVSRAAAQSFDDVGGPVLSFGADDLETNYPWTRNALDWSWG